MRILLGNVEFLQRRKMGLHGSLFQVMHLFEMPLAGYLGYLPFGLECALVANWVLGPQESSLPGVFGKAPGVSQ